MSLIDELKRNVEPGPHYEDDRSHFDFRGSPARVIAYYLPQYHPIPENDQWWGKGFTDWTNVTKSFPRFKGHYQPHLPGELGFYDLRNVDVLFRQAELARRYGLHGFCIHHYWFGGTNLLGQPLRLLLDHPDIEINFCLNWANENWTRRWEGSEKEVLIAQQHSPHDDIALAASLERVFADPRYIRVDGRPLLMLYRPGILPEASATVDRWREHFTHAGLGNPYIVMPQAFGDLDPRAYGMDAAAGFPPHECGFGNRPTRRLSKLTNWSYSGLVLSYDEMMRRALQKEASGFKLFPGVCPGWDNHARRPKGGVVFQGATPQKYGEWLRRSCESSIRQNPPEERFVFVNAWNEWAEGAHLEPDRHFGYAFLAETGRVMSTLANEFSRSDVAVI